MQRTAIRRLATGLIGVLWGLTATITLRAQQIEEPAPPFLPETVVIAEPAFAPVIGSEAVFGDLETVFDAPGSGAYLDQSAITTQSYDNVEKVLTLVPGVYVRPENGFGHFPSISIRGVDTTRSSKLTIMEDGILIAPAPYSAPAVYYFPNVGRMHAVEVIKGGCQITCGPHTTGGAINFLSTPIPAEGATYGRALYGSYGEYRIHTWLGETANTSWGRTGYVLEGYLRESDGFKTINLVPGMQSLNPFTLIGRTANTGFTDGDALLKVFWEPYTTTYQRWDAKVCYTSGLRNETYAGLSEAAFAADPFQRYPATQFDHYEGQHMASYLRYTIGDPEVDWLSVTNTVYYNRFHRNWYKLHDLRSIDGIPGNNMDIGSALAGANGGIGLDVLEGRRVGNWRVRANNRDYYSYGDEITLSAAYETERATHDVLAGFRFHVDEIRPFQHDDQFTIDNQGYITNVTWGTPGSQRNREQETHATAYFVEDEISFGRWSWTPGIRFEHMHMSTVDYNGTGQIFTADLDQAAGGVGATYDVSDELKLLAGFYRGFSPPSPRGATGQGTGPGGTVGPGLHPETSSASEFGFRYLNPERWFGTQLIAFYTHFCDLIVEDIQAIGPGTGNDENIGKAFASGVEFTIQYDAGLDRNWGFGNPWFLVATYTNARLLNDVNSTNPESLYVGGKAGNWLPYIPEWMFTLGTGVEFERVGMNIRGIYVDDAYCTASNTTSLRRPDGTPDSRFGKTDSYFVWDLALYAMLGEQLKLYGGMHNIFDNRYISSRHPYGPRPGAPFFAYMGLEGMY